MRDLTKSMLRVPWSVAMASLAQAPNLMRGKEGAGSVASTFDSISEAAAGRLSGMWGEFYRAGDQLQGGLVDGAMDLATGRLAESGSALRQVWSALDRSLSAIRRQGSQAGEEGSAGQGG